MLDAIAVSYVCINQTSYIEITFINPYLNNSPFVALLEILFSR